MVCSNCGETEFEKIGDNLFQCNYCENITDEEGYEI